MSRNPVRRRKSPYHHEVRNHVRQNRPVRQYERGKGRKPAQPPGRRRRVGNPVVRNPIGNPQSRSAGIFNVHITYFDGDTERLDVDGKNYVEAIAAGEEGRDKPKPPRIIRMRELR